MGRRGGVVVAAAVVILLGLVAIVLTDAVVHHDALAAFDTAVRDWALARRGAVLTGALVTATWLGSTPSLAVLALVTIGWLVRRGRRGDAVLVFAVAAGTFALGPVLKTLIERARPVADHLVSIDSWAYPSGHSMNSMAVLGVLTVLAVRGRDRRWPVLAAAALVGIIGFSRVYLGVHWPSDVLAGWLIGFLWLVICVTVARLVRRG